MPLLRSEFAEPISRRYSAIEEEVAAGDKRAIRPHEECADRSDLVRRSGSSSRAYTDHAPIALAARPIQFIIRQRSDDDARADRIDPRTTLSPPDCFRHHTQRVPAF